MNTMSFRAAVVVAGGLFLAGCGGGTAGTPSTAYCAAIALPTVTMLSPSTGATGISDGNFALVLGSSAALVGTISLNGGSALPAYQGPPFAALSSSPPPAVVSAFAIGTLAPKTTYTVTDSISTGTPCASTEKIGQFTTQ